MKTKNWTYSKNAMEIDNDQNGGLPDTDLAQFDKRYDLGEIQHPPASCEVGLRPYTYCGDD